MEGGSTKKRPRIAERAENEPRSIVILGLFLRSLTESIGLHRSTALRPTPALSAKGRNGKTMKTKNIYSYSGHSGGSPIGRQVLSARRPATVRASEASEHEGLRWHAIGGQGFFGFSFYIFPGSPARAEGTPIQPFPATIPALAQRRALYPLSTGCRLALTD